MKDPVYFAVPGPLTTRTGGYCYDRRIINGLGALGRAVEVLELHGNYPRPSVEDRARADRIFSALPQNATLVVDGLALSVLPDAAEKQQTRLDLVALVHHPLAEETGLDLERRAELLKSEIRALGASRRVIVTSPFTRRSLEALGVASSKISVVAPGCDRAPLATGSGEGGDRLLLCAASLIPRKGHADLFSALAGIEQSPWNLICVGNTELDPETTNAVRALRDALGLRDRITLLGEVNEEELARLYARSDLVVLPSRYEGYGMVVSEAIARGIPVVTTTGGALAETLPSGAGLASMPGDVEGLRENLYRVLSDRNTYLRLAANARIARNGLTDWEGAARAFDAVLAVGRSA